MTLQCTAITQNLDGTWWYHLATVGVGYVLERPQGAYELGQWYDVPESELGF